MGTSTQQWFLLILKWSPNLRVSFYLPSQLYNFFLYWTYDTVLFHTWNFGRLDLLSVVLIFHGYNSGIFNQKIICSELAIPNMKNPHKNPIFRGVRVGENGSAYHLCGIPKPWCFVFSLDQNKSSTTYLENDYHSFPIEHGYSNQRILKIEFEMLTLNKICFFNLKYFITVSEAKKNK